MQRRLNSLLLAKKRKQSAKTRLSIHAIDQKSLITPAITKSARAELTTGQFHSASCAASPSFPISFPDSYYSRHGAHIARSNFGQSPANLCRKKERSLSASRSYIQRRNADTGVNANGGAMTTSEEEQGKKARQKCADSAEDCYRLRLFLLRSRNAMLASGSRPVWKTERAPTSAPPNPILATRRPSPLICRLPLHVPKPKQRCSSP